MVVAPRSERGASRVGCLLGILLLVVAGYVGVLLVGTEIDYQQLKAEVQTQAALAAERDDQAIREALAAEASRLGLPAAAGQPQIRRFPPSRIQIIIQYSDPIDFFGQWQWVLDRRIQIDQTF